MWYKIKVSRDIDVNGKMKHILETYLTEALNFADGAYKVVELVGADAEVEDIMLMKQFKPSVNEQTSEEDKVFIVKIAEDFIQDDGTIKTLKYPVPVFAKSNDELQDILKSYIAQGLESMRVTTISETKWIYIK